MWRHIRPPKFQRMNRFTNSVPDSNAGPDADSSSPSPEQPAASAGMPARKPPRLLDRVRDAIRLRHYSIRTEATYVDWVRRFVLFHGKRHPESMGASEVQAFLTHLATERGVAAATQNQAKSPLLFLYKEVLGVQLPWLDEIVAAKSRERMPVVLTPTEVRALLHELSGSSWLVAALLYGTGMRLLEGLRLRVKDVDFERRELVVRSGKGAKDRVTVLPENLILPLKEQPAPEADGVCAAHWTSSRTPSELSAQACGQPNMMATPCPLPATADGKRVGRAQPTRPPYKKRRMPVQCRRRTDDSSARRLPAPALFQPPITTRLQPGCRSTCPTSGRHRPASGARR
jgi:hypothetical protein